MDVGNKKERSPNPRANANIFEILSFSWVLNIFKTGQKRDLELNDLYSTLENQRSSFLGHELEKRWDIELTKAKKTSRKPSLVKVLIQMFGVEVTIYTFLQTFVEVVLRMVQPIIFGRLLGYFNSGELVTTDLRHAYIYASSLMLCILANMCLYHFSQLGMLQCGMKMRVACFSMIFKKTLRLSKTSLGETTIGQVVNLSSNDVNRFDLALRFIHFLFIGPLVTIVIVILVWREIGVSSLVGITGFLAFIPFQGWLGKKSFEFRYKTASLTDERVRLMNEIISGMHVIKMYTLEKPFSYLVQHIRKLEIRQIRGAMLIKIFMGSFKIFHSKIALFLSILSYVFLGNNINTEKVFVIIWYYIILNTTMTVFFPMAITQIAEVSASIKRIQNFLLYDEKDERNEALLKSENTFDNGGITIPIINHINSKDKGIIISNAFAKWAPDNTEYSLNNISTTVSPGCLAAIIGPVGSGKSSLLQAILRELPLSKGSISVNGVVSYVSQEPWLFNSSIQQNILFDSSMDNERYKQVVHVCALNIDFKQLPFGDRTIVGERGVSLSGGQRARINLARAVYKKADIYLLDDPLSVVDTHVGKHLFEKCIKGYLKEKICILVTHQVQHLKKVDQIVLMQNGSILSEGSYQELQSSGFDFLKSLEPLEDKSAQTDTESTSSLNPLSFLSRNGSIQGESLSIDESELKEFQMEPVEVEETRSSGKVKNRIYFAYISAGGNIFKISSLILVCIVTQILVTGADYWISFWVNLEDRNFRYGNWIMAKDNSTSFIDDSSSTLLWWPVTRQTCIVVFATLNLMLFAIIFIRCAVITSVLTKASTNLHNNMFTAITRAKMYFFNTNSSGRILNRFTKDMGIIDEVLPGPILDFIHVWITLVGSLIVFGYINIYLMVPTFIVGVLFYYITIFYLSTSRSITRLEGVSRSPILSHVNTCLQGLTTIRAFKAEEILTKEFYEHQDLHSSAWHLFISSSQAFGFVLDMVCTVYIGFIIYSFLVIDNGTFAGNVGLVITQIMSLTGVLQWGIRQTAELANQMTSVERVLEYTNVPQEGALESSSDKKPPSEWPKEGQLVFQKFNLRYSLDTPHVLKNLNIRIQPSEKVGIVGRTGAGKSSLITALFRLALNEGNIIIDGVEIHELGLHELRSKISIIPQEPVLFSGTMRKNLDPFDEYPDHDLWNALDEVELKDVVNNFSNGLDSAISEGGSNFSVGQRQLVCLARAILRRNKFLVLDEATANIDSQTDALIQNTIKNKFRTCTVLTIAHRLNTIMNSDKVIVMDAGTMVEFDHPYNLMKNPNGYFYKMVEQTGRDSADLLRDVAAKSYKTTQMAKLSSDLSDGDANEATE